MGKTPSPFAIHVDGSCLTDSTDLGAPKQREASSDTVVHDPPTDDSTQTDANNKRSAERDLLDAKIQAQIHEAARQVVADIERSRYDEQEESLLSSQTDESEGMDGTELTYDGTELTYDGTEVASEIATEDYSALDGNELDSQIDQALDEWEPENSQIGDEQDSSSHHGDDDDVFSEESGRSQRSSMNSIHDLNSSDEAYQKRLASPTVGEEAASTSESVSRIPSMASYTHEETNFSTPNKSKNRPPFRTPSSVRAMQMGSPTPSIFASPRSAKRHHPAGSRLGTPTSQFSPSKRTPTRFKAKKEEPLNLLHATVMPIQWPYSHCMSSKEVPDTLLHVKESWRLLYDKLADTVLERGILLPHPQDSYEVLEERLLEALELPVRPRATILKCGHYMGPSDAESPSSDDEQTAQTTYFQRDAGTGRKWCDICRRDVKLENTGEVCGKRRFHVKIFASNGLMRAGAWAAAWREMERVDVEIEPWVDTDLRAELAEFAATMPIKTDEEDDFVDEDEHVEEVVEKSADDFEVDSHPQSEEEKEIIRKFEEEERQHRLEEETKIQALLAEEKAAQRKQEQEEELQRQATGEEKIRTVLARSAACLSGSVREDGSRRTTLSDDRMREIYGRSSPLPTIPDLHYDEEHINTTQQRQRPVQTVDPDSLPDLLFAAFKVLLRDKKNITIGFLSILVLLLALKPHTSTSSVEPSTALLQVATPELAIEVSKEVRSLKDGLMIEAKEDRVSYITVTATSTVAAEPVVVTTTKEIAKEAQVTNEPIRGDKLVPDVEENVSENAESNISSESENLESITSDGASQELINEMTAQSSNSDVEVEGSGTESQVDIKSLEDSSITRIPLRDESIIDVPLDDKGDESLMTEEYDEKTIEV